MKILIIGPNGSGKSAFAEKIAAGRKADALYYIATMLPFGEEGQRRVRKHRTQRAEYGFVTLELPFCLSEAKLPCDSVVLLEDVSNLLGNAVFEKGGSGEDVYRDIKALCESCRDCVMVTIGELEPSPEYDRETLRYIDELHRLNRRLSEYAELVITMDNGVPNCTKGDAHGLD